MMQILELVLYSYDGRRRKLAFNLGQVNIITGKSRSGKSAVGDIIEYCLGGQSCNIADGVVRESVSWYALLLQFDDERVFVARENPGVGVQSTTSCYVETGKELESPEKADFVSNVNVDGIEDLLSRRLGIEENVNIPQEGQTRTPLTANIRHSLFYCFQGQDEIAARSHLFHRQAEQFITQAIKDTLPYFLGAVDGQALKLEAERKEKNRELSRLKRALSDEREIRGVSTSRGASLFEEAVAVGLARKGDVDQTDFNSLYDYLRQLELIEVAEPNNHADQLATLQQKHLQLTEELSAIGYDLREAKQYQGYTKGFGDEAYYQKSRLESIGLFDKINFDTGKCPFCSANLEQQLPGVEAIKESIVALDDSIGQISREQPRLQQHIETLQRKAEDLRNQRRDIADSIQALFESESRLKEIRDLNERRALVLGRISLWVETVSREEDYSELETKQQELIDRLKVLDDLLDRENTEDRVHAALSNMQSDMTTWAKDLNLEGGGYAYRLDYHKATVVMDKDRTIPLNQMGSGSNWVGVHLIAMFALQEFFVKHERPVPGFLFLDQPSQVYFPSMEHKDENKDLQAVSKIYQFIYKQVASMAGKAQVIIVDHAQLDDPTFEDNVIESWWDDDKNLVPIEWIKN